MKTTFHPERNLEKTKKLVGYLPRLETKPQTYGRLGFKCGLEIHQQLLTDHKLFCHCPAGHYHRGDEFDAEVVRHMRPTLSELGGYDGTALMEFKTRKTIIYRLKNETTCTYEVDDTPPFKVNLEALKIAMEIALLLKTNIVGELHITRKQYLDGSIPTGFQRTAIVGIEGQIPLKHKKVGIIQLSIEEDSCREVSDVGHVRVYNTDRLSMPLIETVTYPEMKTPEEAAEAAHYIRFLCRSTGKVRTGIGATRQDVNVSVTGGTRIEIKGVARIAWIPELTHNEGFRQKALLDIAKELKRRFADPAAWKPSWREVEYDFFRCEGTPLADAAGRKDKLIAVNLPGWQGLLSFFTQPGQTFADELSGRLKVIACLERPNLLHSESIPAFLNEEEQIFLRKLLKAGENDAQLLIWGPAADMPTALETITERCQLAFQGVPNETRQARADGTTVFERVLPGPDRMYPDTDSAPIPITDEMIDGIRARLPVEVRQRVVQLTDWGVPEDVFPFLLKLNLVPLIERIVADFGTSPKFVATLLGHRLKHLDGQAGERRSFPFERIHDLFGFVKERGLQPEIVPDMLAVVYEHPAMEFPSVLTTLGYKPASEKEVLAHLPLLREKFSQINTSKDPKACTRWIMGNLRPLALGNVAMPTLLSRVEKGEGR